MAMLLLCLGPGSSAPVSNFPDSWHQNLFPTFRRILIAFREEANGAASPVPPPAFPDVDIYRVGQKASLREFILQVIRYLKDSDEDYVLFVRGDDVLLFSNLSAIVPALTDASQVVIGTQRFDGLGESGRAITCRELAMHKHGVSLEQFLIADADKRITIVASGVFLSRKLLLDLEPLIKLASSDHAVERFLIGPPFGGRLLQVDAPLIGIRRDSPCTAKHYCTVSFAKDEMLYYYAHFFLSNSLRCRRTYGQLLFKLIAAHRPLAIRLICAMMLMQVRFLARWGIHHRTSLYAIGLAAAARKLRRRFAPGALA